MSSRRAITITGAAAYHLLKFTHEASDVLPPLKSVAGGALYVTDLVVKFRSRKKEWEEFGTYVQEIVATIVESLKLLDGEQNEIHDKLKEFEFVLNGIAQTIKTKQGEGFSKRILHFVEHPEMIAELRQKVDDAVNLLQFDAVVKTEIEVKKTLKVAENNSEQLSKAALGAARSKLRYVEGASWDPNRVCLEHTRKDVINEILAWVDNATDSRTENIMLLTGVAGAGKSTIAHTIAQHYSSSDQLVTSFFFDRETNERSNPNRLIGTIASDLCQTNRILGNHIMRVIEGDEGVVAAPISRQFDELVLKPCRDFVGEQPLVVVLDGLDEGYDEPLLAILSEKVHLLPHRICFIVTARTLPFLEDLRQQPHVHEVELDIHASQSIDDVALFVTHRLKKVARRHRLGDHWPDPELAELLKARAEGLFIWVATVCDYLLNRTNPTNELQKLVSTSHPSNMSAESKMDQLYTTILEACDWEDGNFVEDYQRLMGAAVASKTPLTLGALECLYQLTPVISYLARSHLSPLLTGLGDGKGTLQLVRFLHQSLRDFLTLRAHASSGNPSLGSHKFVIDEKAHSQALAFRCLSQMNRELNSNTPGVGYLSENASVGPGIPSVAKSRITEALGYACQFWVDHLLDVDLPLFPSMLKELEEFLRERLIQWMELMAVYGRYEGLLKLQNWVMKQAQEQKSLMSMVFKENHGSALSSLSSRMDYMGRLEEALIASREGVEIYRQLMADGSSGPRGRLSESLHTLSVRLHKLGYREDAFAASEESLKLRRQLAIEQPGVFTSDLAHSVHSLSVYLSNVGRHEEALEAIEEAVKLRRQLASERPAAFTSDLSNSIHSLSIDLASFGRHEEALEAIEEAVKLRRQLASERPAAFTSDLASSVHELSIRLASFGRHEEALEAIEEAVKLLRHLASERPAAFTSHLANSVHSLSIDLANVGRHEEALEAIEEAVKLRRLLASERPAAFTSDLAYSGHELSVRLASFGRHEEALEAIEEAVKLRRQLASERPAAFTSDLADSVHELSNCLYNLGRHEEALKASEEAVELRRQLASERPAAFTPNLALSLYNLAFDYNHRGWHRKALAAIKESAELYHPFAEKYPARYGTEYSDALRLLEKYSANVGTDEEAPAASAEPNAAASAE